MMSVYVCSLVVERSTGVTSFPYLYRHHRGTAVSCNHPIPQQYRQSTHIIRRADWYSVCGRARVSSGCNNEWRNYHHDHGVRS